MKNFFYNSSKSITPPTTTTPPVSLHPVNERHPSSNNNNNNNLLSNSFSNLMSSSSDQSNQFKPSTRVLKSTRPSPPTPSNSTTRQSNFLSRNTKTLPKLGLELNSTIYPILPSSPSFNTRSTSSSNSNSNSNSSQEELNPIRLITAHEYAKIYNSYLEVELPLDSLFPYLHTGTEIPGSNSGRFFGFDRGDFAKRPTNYKGLTILTPPISSSSPSSSPLPNSHLLVSTLPLSNFLEPLPYPSTSPFSLSQNGNRIKTPPKASFKNVSPPPDRPVNLRGFAQQGSKYGRISDVVIYGPFGLNPRPRGRSLEVGGEEREREGLIELAKRVREAMEGENESDGRGGGYTVFVVTDPFSVFEEYYPELIAINGKGVVENKLDFSIREAEEMRVLTVATKIARNVYLGNTQDVPDLPSPSTSTTHSSNSSSSHSSYHSHSHSHSQSHQSFHSSHSQPQFQSQPTLSPKELNPLGISICVEGHEQASILTREELDLYSELLDRRAAVRGKNRGRREGSDLVDIDLNMNMMVDEEKEEEKAEEVPRELVHLEILPSSLSLSEELILDRFMNGLVEMGFWLFDQANPSFSLLTSTGKGAEREDRRREGGGRKILLHCRDGYTETSLLALVYLMIEKRQGVAQAYLDLHNFRSVSSSASSLSSREVGEEREGEGGGEGEGGRSFFVYEKDKKVLEALEILVEQKWEERDEKEWKFNLELALGGKGDGEGGIGVGMGRSDSGFVEGENLPSSISSISTSTATAILKGVNGKKVEGLEERIEGDEILTEELVEKWLETEWREREGERKFKRSDGRLHPWYFAESWEGVFPSKILDGLYLGNLAHATNALMLKAIGITHVVSVGESALFPPLLPSLSNNNNNNNKNNNFRQFSTSRSSSSSSLVPNSLWLESQSLSPSLTVLDLKNINDDGIDSIRPCLDEAIEFIDEAIESGGKVLVHCKVGVSRSASVVIAYLMKYMEWDLASAYLLTRSRRLNILIQPNLPFVATLHAFEAELIKSKEIRDSEISKRGGSIYERPMGETGLRRSNRLTWSALSWELFALNQRFLEW